MPCDFDEALGGTTAAPKSLNDQNKMHISNYIQNVSHCDYLIDYEDDDRMKLKDIYFRNRNETWIIKNEKLFLNANKSPKLTRAFYIPYLSEKNNIYGKFRLYEKQ